MLKRMSRSGIGCNDFKMYPDEPILLRDDDALSIIGKISGMILLVAVK